MSWRIEQLDAIRAMVDASYDRCIRRRGTSLVVIGRPPMDVDSSIREVDYALDRLHDWLRQDHVHTRKWGSFQAPMIGGTPDASCRTHRAARARARVRGRANRQGHQRPVLRAGWGSVGQC